jgi:phosphoribosylamine---glycine ligase
MRLLLVGGGGREHALAWRLRHDFPEAHIFAAPGNPGIADVAKCVPIAANDVEALLTFALQESIDWTVVGPEAPLAAGIVDTFRAARAPIFGPTRQAAQLETSKAFAKTLMSGAGVPTARAVTCDSVAMAFIAIEEIGAPLVVKASGLAAGKGVIICPTTGDARTAAASMREQHAFGDAGATILIEEFMEGEELSVFVLTDGERTVVLPPAQDHKRLLDGDRGPNTGGMGAYSPVSLVERSPELIGEVLASIVHPTLAAMRGRGMPFTGLLYAGLMLTDDGPKVVEFNCRFGDPETQAVLPAISRDESIGELLQVVARGGTLPDVTLHADRSAVTTVLAASGYPDAPRAGDGIIIPPIPDDVLVFHAGTKCAPNGALVTAGGRVLGVTGLGPTLEDAQRISQQFAGAIGFEGKQCRGDIGWRELARRAGAT